ncbi:MAG: hypothetical protein INR62_01815 [Rhodospirillales bacterium]|nr:hypothetical protein [Acetobacter sp.]
MNQAPSAPVRTSRREVALCPAAFATPLTLEQLLTHDWLLRRIMADTMREGVHYGHSPAGRTDKPSLLEAGAQLLCRLFRLASAFDVEERQLASVHREYRVAATLTSRVTGALVGQGLGVGSTLEAACRFHAKLTDEARWGAARVRPETRQERHAGAQKFSGGGKTDADDPPARHNLVLAAAKGRALVDAALATTAASDLFSQDLEAVSAGPLTPPAATLGGGDTAVDFRFTPVHFGKNRGSTLAELTPQQIHWYEKEWMPRREVEGPRGAGDRGLIAGLKAYRRWRDAEKQAQTAANPPSKRARRSTQARNVQPA